MFDDRFYTLSHVVVIYFDDFLLLMPNTYYQRCAFVNNVNNSILNILQFEPHRDNNETRVWPTKALTY